MSSTVREAALEATILLQAFVSGIEVLQFYWVFSGGRYNHHVFGYITQLIAPLLTLVLLFTILTQLKLSSPNRKQTLRLELAKSALVTVLWVWLLVWGWTGWGNGHRGDTTGKIVETVVSLVIVGVIFYSTLIVAWRRERVSGRISLRDEAAGLLPN